MTTLLIATRNAHKVGEIQAILGASFRCLALNDFPGAPPVREDAATFAGNAAKKAVEIARWLTQGGQASRTPPGFVLADDSGLEVDCLHGAPGVHSARFAALDRDSDGRAGVDGNSPDAENNAKLLRCLHGVPLERRAARFRCVLALVAVPVAHPESASPVCHADELAPRFFEGACEGRIQMAASGGGGFGYDPLFVPEGCTQSFAELGEELKNRLSHRARALAQLKLFFTPHRPSA